MDAGTLEALGLNRAELEERIVQAVATMMYQDMEHDVRKEAMSRAWPQVAAKLSLLVEETLSHRFVPINKWGERTGSETTLREMVLEQLTKYWDTRVDSKGEPTTSSYDRTTTRAEWMLKTLISAEIKKQIEIEVKAAWDPEVKALRKALVAWIEERFKA